MAKNTTYSGKIKPAGKSGHFYETRRHQLQGKGIRTGNLSKSTPVPKQKPLIDLGILPDATYEELDKQYPSVAKQYQNSVRFKRVLERVEDEHKEKFIKDFNALSNGEKEVVLHFLKDTDGDEVIDIFDCDPYDPTKQDLKGFVSKVGEKLHHGAEVVGEKLKGASEFVRKEVGVVKEKLHDAGEFVKHEAEVVKEKLHHEPKEKGLLSDFFEPEADITYEPTKILDPSVAQPETPAPIEVGAEELEIEGDEIEVKNPSKGFLSEFFEGFGAEKEAKSKKLQRKAYKDLGREKELDDFETPSFPSRGAKMGKMLADLFGDYRSEDLVDLTDVELEELAVKYDAHSSGFFGKPPNPFLDELKSRLRSREHVKFEKAKLDAELEPSRIRIQQEIKQMRDDAKKRGEKGGGDIMERLLGF